MLAVDNVDHVYMYVNGLCDKHVDTQETIITINPKKKEGMVINELVNT